MIAESSDKQIKQLESRTHYELQVPTQAGLEVTNH